MSAGSMKLQMGISWILRIGVFLSVVFEAAGLLLNYFETGSSALALTDSWRIAGGNFFDFAYSVGGSLLEGFRAFTLVSTGIVILMLTPYLRVLAAVVYYAVERDWKYVAITSTVFILITIALLVFRTPMKGI